MRFDQLRLGLRHVCCSRCLRFSRALGSNLACFGICLFFGPFSGFAIDRSKKYIKTMKSDRKIDAVDPQAAADNLPPTPGHNGQVYGTLQPTKPHQIVQYLGS